MIQDKVENTAREAVVAPIARREAVFIWIPIENSFGMLNSFGAGGASYLSYLSNLAPMAFASMRSEVVERPTSASAVGKKETSIVAASEEASSPQ